MTIILHPDAIDEIGIWVTESGIQLRLEAASGDKCFIELGDEVVGYIIEQLVYYAWNITVEEAFGHNADKENLPEVATVAQTRCI